MWRVILVAMVVVGGAGCAQACPVPANDVVTQSAKLRMGSVLMNVDALSLVDPNTERTRLLVRDNRCRILLDETVDGLETRFDLRMLGNARLLQFVTMLVFGDGTNYVHRLFVWRGNGLVRVGSDFIHTGKDGFYLGPLGHDKGDGVAMWVADPRGEAEAQAHPYVVSTWQWRASRLEGPMSYETPGRYMPSDDVVPRSNIVARAIGLPYRDQTGTDAFMDPDMVMKKQNSAEE